MTQLLIRRCTLRLHRRGGWSWGRDPQKLVQTATRALPEFIAQKLAHLLASEDQSASIGHLAIRIPVRLSELDEIGLQPETHVTSTNLIERIAGHCRQSLEAQTAVLDRMDGPQDLEVPSAAELDSLEAPSTIPDFTNIHTLLVQWYQQGRLVRLVQYFDDKMLGAWEKLVLDSLPTVRFAPEETEQRPPISHELCEKICDAASRLATVRSRRILLLAALLQQYSAHISRDELLEMLNRDLPISVPSKLANNGQSAAEIAQATLPTSHVQSDSASEAKQSRHGQLARSRSDFELNASSVLPFVAVGVLSRLGYFEALATALEVSGYVDQFESFIAALAYKMLPSPHRGWHRDERDQLTAAALAGSRGPITGSQIERFAKCCGDCLAPADGLLRISLAEGHDLSRPMFVHRMTIAEQSYWILVDSQGCFVVGWFEHQQEFLRELEQFAGGFVLLSEAAADTQLLSQLAERHRFITTLPPLRGDRWRAVDRHRTRWTNDWVASARLLAHQSECMHSAKDGSERVTTALLESRPILPVPLKGRQLPDALHKFDRSIALAAASALGVIAWQLWGDREVTDPVLALERLGDLDGRVTIRRDAVIVRPALGRRYQDLSRHNLLVPVANLRWLQGRRLEFVGL